MISSDAECGDLIVGTGGFRKVRVGRGSMGQSGGARSVCIRRNEKFPVFLVAVYGKAGAQSIGEKRRRNLHGVQEIDHEQNVRGLRQRTD